MIMRIRDQIEALSIFVVNIWFKRIYINNFKFDGF